MGVCVSRAVDEDNTVKAPKMKKVVSKPPEEEKKELTALELSLLKAEKRVHDVPSDSVEGRALRRWSLTHKKKYEEEEKERRQSSLSKFAKRVSSTVRRASSTVLNPFSLTNGKHSMAIPEKKEECGFD